MISYHDASRHNNFCKCTHSSSVFTEMDGDIGMFVMIAINLLKTHIDIIGKIILA